MKKVLVTGGAGFLGSHLCERLVKQGHDVICLDNFFTGSKSNINHLRNLHNFELVRHDITEPFIAEVDEIYNLACPASPVHYQFDPIKTIRTNVQGSLNMLELARTVKAKILQASTSEVYGDPQVHPQPETYCGNVNPIRPRACYDEGKRCAETLFINYHEEAKVPIKIMRIFNTYGPRMSQNDGRVVSNFIVQALNGEDLTLYGDGRQTRSFCYVDDNIDAMIKLMNSPDKIIGPINIGTPFEFTMLELAQLIIKLTDSNSKLIHKDLPKDDPLQRKPDISKAKELLNWEPQTKLEEGLSKTIEYFKTVI